MISNLLLKLLLWNNRKLKLIYHQTILHCKRPKYLKIQICLFLNLKHKLLLVLFSSPRYHRSFTLMFLQRNLLNLFNIINIIVWSLSNSSFHLWRNFVFFHAFLDFFLKVTFDLLHGIYVCFVHDYDVSWA